MKKQSKYHPETGKSTFGQNISHGEVVFGTKVFSGGPSEFGQNLSAKKGTDGAKALIMDRRKK